MPSIITASAITFYSCPSGHLGNLSYYGKICWSRRPEKQSLFVHVYIAVNIDDGSAHTRRTTQTPKPTPLRVGDADRPKTLQGIYLMHCCSLCWCHVSTLCTFFAGFCQFFLISILFSSLFLDGGRGVLASESQCKRDWPLHESYWMQKRWSTMFLLIGIRKGIWPVKLHQSPLLAK